MAERPCRAAGTADYEPAYFQRTFEVLTADSLTADPALVTVGAGNRYFVTEVIVRSQVRRVYDERTNDYEDQVDELSGGVIEAGPVIFSEVWLDSFEVNWAAHYGDVGKLTGAGVESIEYLGRLAADPRR